MEIEKPKRVFYVGSPELFSRGASAIHIMKMCQAMARLGVTTTLLIPTYRPHGEIYQYYGVQSSFRIVSFPYFANSSVRNITHGVAAAVYAGGRKGEFDLAVTRNIVFASIAANFYGIPTLSSRARACSSTRSSAPGASSASP